MKSILTETEKHQLRQVAQRLLLSPDGRDFCRPLQAERGKEEGNVPQVTNELLDLLAENIRNLYSSPAPTVSGR